MALDKEQIKYIERLLDSKERTAQPLERLYINGLKEKLTKLKNKNNTSIRATDRGIL